jgi:hypothetical protein
MKAPIKGYGTVEFDPMNPSDNIYDLYTVAVLDPETDEVTKEEHYLTVDDFNDAISNTYGREDTMNGESWCGWCDVHTGFDGVYECECTHYVEYVVDTDEE